MCIGSARPPAAAAAERRRAGVPGAGGMDEARKQLLVDSSAPLPAD